MSKKDHHKVGPNIWLVVYDYKYKHIRKICPFKYGIRKYKKRFLAIHLYVKKYTGKSKFHCGKFPQTMKYHNLQPSSKGSYEMEIANEIRHHSILKKLNICITHGAFYNQCRCALLPVQLPVRIEIYGGKKEKIISGKTINQRICHD